MAVEWIVGVMLSLAVCQSGKEEHNSGEEQIERLLRGSLWLGVRKAMRTESTKLVAGLHSHRGLRKQ